MDLQGSGKIRVNMMGGDAQRILMLGELEIPETDAAKSRWGEQTPPSITHQSKETSV